MMAVVPAPVPQPLSWNMVFWGIGGSFVRVTFARFSMQSPVSSS